MLSEVITLASVISNLASEKIVDDEAVRICIQNQLHHIKSLENNIDLLKEVFNDEPLIYSNIPDYVYAYIAAMTEQITIEKNIQTPAWVNKYYLETPWFPPETLEYNNLKKVLMRCSPEPFKKRNLFVSKNALSVY